MQYSGFGVTPPFEVRAVLEAFGSVVSLKTEAKPGKGIAVYKEASSAANAKRMLNGRFLADNQVAMELQIHSNYPLKMCPWWRKKLNTCTGEGSKGTPNFTQRTIVFVENVGTPEASGESLHNTLYESFFLTGGLPDRTIPVMVKRVWLDATRTERFNLVKYMTPKEAATAVRLMNGSVHGPIRLLVRLASDHDDQSHEQQQEERVRDVETTEQEHSTHEPNVKMRERQQGERVADVEVREAKHSEVIADVKSLETSRGERVVNTSNGKTGETGQDQVLVIKGKTQEMTQRERVPDEETRGSRAQKERGHEVETQNAEQGPSVDDVQPHKKKPGKSVADAKVDSDRQVESVHVADAKCQGTEQAERKESFETSQDKNLISVRVGGNCKSLETNNSPDPEMPELISEVSESDTDTVTESESESRTDESGECCEAQESGAEEELSESETEESVESEGLSESQTEESGEDESLEDEEVSRRNADKEKEELLRDLEYCLERLEVREGDKEEGQVREQHRWLLHVTDDSGASPGDPSAGAREKNSDTSCSELQGANVKTASTEPDLGEPVEARDGENASASAHA